MRVASAGLVYWVARFFLLGTKARILGLTELKYRKEKQKWDSRIKSKIEFFLSQKQKGKKQTQDTEWDQFWWLMSWHYPVSKSRQKQQKFSSWEWVTKHWVSQWVSDHCLNQQTGKAFLSHKTHLKTTTQNYSQSFPPVTVFMEQLT